MAHIRERTGKSWKVCVDPKEVDRISMLRASGLCPSELQQLPQRLDRAFGNQCAANEMAARYRLLGIQSVVRTTIAWQPRIRLAGAPSLTDTFPTKRCQNSGSGSG